MLLTLLQAACSSFLYGMSVAQLMFNLENIKKVLLIGADKMSSSIIQIDLLVSFFGDGAGAVLFEPNHEGLGIQDEYLRSDGVGRDFLKIDAGGSLHPTSLKRWKRTDITSFKTEKLFLNTQ
jgi:3-oxoacyl-[acyl-carrier-protein] synthase-3